MSQEKVDKYKKSKANRKKEVARQKFIKKMYKLGAVVVGLALVAWIGYSVYDAIVNEDEETEQQVVTLSAEELEELQSILNEQASATQSENQSGTEEVTSGETSEEVSTEEATTQGAE